MRHCLPPLVASATIARMSEPVPFESAEDEDERRCRPRPFWVWLLCAGPWLAAVTALTVYDHHRAIVRSIEGYFAEDAPEASVLGICG
jgi:hypothetical protein